MPKHLMPWNGLSTLLVHATDAKTSIRVSVTSLVNSLVGAKMDLAGACFISVKILVANVSFNKKQKPGPPPLICLLCCAILSPLFTLITLLTPIPPSPQKNDTICFETFVGDSCEDNSEETCSDASCSVDYKRLFHCKKSCESCQVKCGLGIKIQDAVTKSNLADVGVTFKIATLGLSKVSQTDSDGQVSLTEIPETATATISGEKSGYFSVDTSATIKDHCDGVLTLGMVRECSLTLKVVDLDGSNLDGVQVEVTVPDTASKVIATDGSGQAKFEKLPETATAAITLSKSKYTPVQMSKPMKDNCNAVLPMVTLIRECDLTIKATGLDGSVLEGVEITLSIAGKAPKVMTTGSDGQAKYEKVAQTATASFVLSKDKYTSVDLTKPVKDNCDAVLPVTLIRQCSLTIKATDNEGSPLENAKVTMTIDGVDSEMTTGNDGQASFTGLSESATAAFTLEKTDYKDAAMTKTIQENCDAVVPVAMEPKCSIIIKATDSISDSPLDDTKVTMTIDGVETEMTTGSDRQASFTGLSAGTASFKLTKIGYDDGEVTKTLEDNCGAVVPVAMVKGPTCSFGFKITDAISGDSISGATVTLTSTDIPEQAVQSSGSGVANVPDVLYNVDLTITVSKSSYDNEIFNFNSKDKCTGHTFPAAMNPTSPDGRLILTWGSDDPKDLDFYTSDSTGCTIYYDNLRCRDNTLDKDNFVRTFVFSSSHQEGNTLRFSFKIQ